MAIVQKQSLLAVVHADVERGICHDEDCKDVAAWDSEVGTHHAVANHVAAFEHTDVVMCGTVVSRYFVQSTQCPLAGSGPLLCMAGTSPFFNINNQFTT